MTADGRITQANLMVYIPSNTSNQRVTSIQISEPYTLEMNGSSWIANIILRDFSEKTVKGRFIVSTDYIRRGQSQELSRPEHLSTSRLVDINQDIKEVASQFSGFPSPNNTIELVEWVHGYITYDRAFVPGSVPASEVLRSRRGVCDEYSHLLIAMARSIGIPARIIVGYAFDTSGTIYGNDTWTPHAWAEVYDSKLGWVEVDPTYGEFLNLDALRVRIATGRDQEETRDMIEAIGIAKELNMSTNVEIRILKKSDDSKVDVDMELAAQPRDSLHQPVMIIVKNSNKYPVFMTASLVVPQGFECNCSSKFFLQPGERRTLPCDINLSGIIPDVRYNFTVKAVTDYGAVEGSFERLIVVPEYTSVQELPVEFMIFIGVAVAIAIILIIIAIFVRL
ncbi:MAG: transglutaminase-like domain-containing protein [Candidatus Micrarchaeia archaeon]